MVGFRNGHIHKNLTQSGEPLRSSWGTQKKKKYSPELHDEDGLKCSVYTPSEGRENLPSMLCSEERLL